DECQQLQVMIDHLRRLGLCETEEYENDTMHWANTKIEVANQSLRDPVARANALQFAPHAALFFSSESQLESLIERAIEDPSWREQRITRAVQEMPKEMTIDGFSRELLGFVRSKLDA